MRVLPEHQSSAPALRLGLSDAGSLKGCGHVAVRSVCRNGGLADDELVERYAVRSCELSASASRKSGTRRTDFEEGCMLEDGRAIEESLAGRILGFALIV